MAADAAVAITRLEVRQPGGAVSGTTTSDAASSTGSRRTDSRERLAGLGVISSHSLVLTVVSATEP
ncbi:MAG TPA: hypothetical protein VGN98_14330, partial [Tianweitania sediminis]|nr:hypothetical protein [Tianweitania sediminis]